MSWLEFPAGPQLLEGLNAGAVDIGTAGETPPIFAQAAGVEFVYVGNEPPAPSSEAIVVPQDSPIESVADLRGKKVALNKGFDKRCGDRIAVDLEALWYAHGPRRHRPFNCKGKLRRDHRPQRLRKVDAAAPCGRPRDAGRRRIGYEWEGVRRHERTAAHEDRVLQRVLQLAGA